MIRDLVIVRHAHAEPPVAGAADMARILNAKGLGEAEAVGRWIREHQLNFDRALCSPAARARSTAEIALGAAASQLRFEPAIYEATPGALIALLDAAGDGCTLLVGHNPGVEQLVALLTEGRSDEFRGMPPGSVAWLTLPKGAELEPGVAQLKVFWSP